MAPFDATRACRRQRSEQRKHVYGSVQATAGQTNYGASRLADLFKNMKIEDILKKHLRKTNSYATPFPITWKKM